MELQERIQAFTKLGSVLNNLTAHAVHDENFRRVSEQAYLQNQWFTEKSVLQSISAIALMLDEKKLNEWLINYSKEIKNDNEPKDIGVIMAGNIPLVGFHDALCVLISGNKLLAKLSKDDAVLMPYLVDLLAEIEPAFKNKISYVNKLEKPDAVIATGSNNSARYFEYYFGRYPHIIRKNRNSAAILTGDELENELIKLGEDIFSYFGLGCRNVSKLFVPEEYDFDFFFKAMQHFSYVMEHHKYMNNYDYNRAVLLLNNEKFLTNNFLIVRAHTALTTPVSVVHYESYKDINDLDSKLKSALQQLQCVTVAGAPWKQLTVNTIPFGTAQCPQLNDYADNVDTLQFLLSLNTSNTH